MAMVTPMVMPATIARQYQTRTRQTSTSMVSAMPAKVPSAATRQKKEMRNVILRTSVHAADREKSPVVKMIARSRSAATEWMKTTTAMHGATGLIASTKTSAALLVSIARKKTRV